MKDMSVHGVISNITFQATNRGATLTISDTAFIIAEFLQILASLPPHTPLLDTWLQRVADVVMSVHD